MSGLQGGADHKSCVVGGSMKYTIEYDNENDLRLALAALDLYNLIHDFTEEYLRPKWKHDNKRDIPLNTLWDDWHDYLDGYHFYEITKE